MTPMHRIGGGCKVQSNMGARPFEVASGVYGLGTSDAHPTAGSFDGCGSVR
jgi:hypothetical protein